MLRFDLSADGVVSNPEPVQSCGDAELVASTIRKFAERNLGPQESPRENAEVLLVFRPDATPAPESPRP
jgi:hypothetical protein